MNLSTVRAPKKASEKRKRVGRGMGSGMGKTSTRGHKGQRSRSGSRLLRGFEGGQMPLHRRLPKRGFTNVFRKEYNEVNLGRVQQAIDAGKLDPAATIDVETLIKAGVLRRARAGVRLLGSGEIKARVAITVAGASKSAVAAVEKAGASGPALKAAEEGEPRP